MSPELTEHKTKVRYTVTILFTLIVIMLAVLGKWAWDAKVSTDNHQTDNAIAACKRGNVLRATINDNNSVVTDFLNAAGEARQSSADGETDPAQKAVDAKAAKAYFALAARQKNLPLVNCEDAYK